MLYLDRKVGQSIIVGKGEDAVEVHVLSMDTVKVRLGFECKKNIPIVREEVLRRDKAKLQSAKSSSPR